MEDSTLQPVSDDTHAIKAYHAQISLVVELKELHALVDVCRLALAKMGQTETDSCHSVLMLASNRMYELSEAQAERETQLEAAAYPAWTQGEKHLQAVKGLQAHIVAERVQTLRGLLAEMRRIYNDPQGFGDIHGMLDEAYELADQLRARVSGGAA